MFPINVYVFLHLGKHCCKNMFPVNISSITISSIGPVTRCNFSCNLQRNSTFKRCKFVTNVKYVKNILANCDGNLYFSILHLPRVELHCKLQKELHRVTGPYVFCPFTGKTEVVRTTTTTNEKEKLQFPR